MQLTDDYALIEAASLSPASGAAEWNHRLEKERDFLLNLVSDIETEFLDRGNALSLLSDGLSDIQLRCQNLSEQDFADSQAAAVQFAFELLKKSEDLVQASYDQYEQVFSAFSELQSRLAQLSRKHAEIMGVVLPLNLISIGFRIEASRHPMDVQRIYTTLAGNIKGMINEVGRTMGQQFEDFETSDRVAQGLMEKVHLSIQQQKIEVAATLASNRKSLHFLNDALADSGTKAQELSAQNAAVTRHIGVIVMAQQCQDITRQKIEHISHAMDDMRAQLTQSESDTTQGPSNGRRFVSTVAKIQIHQAREVFEQLHGAADSLVNGIHGLRVEAGAAAESAVSVGGRARDARDASLQCQNGVRLILEIVEKSVQRITDILNLLKPMQSQFVDCTSRATNLAIDLRLSAVNAQIFALQVPDGATLEALAGRMRMISDETLEKVTNMGLGLSQVIEHIKNLEQTLEDFQAIGQMEQQILADESNTSQKRLFEVEGKIPNAIRQITDKQTSFTQSIETILNGVKFPDTVEAARLRSIDFFRSLASWGSEGGVGMLGEDPSEQMELLKAKYTMESERRAHSAAFGQDSGPAPSTEEELGNNVELF